MPGCPDTDPGPPCANCGTKRGEHKGDGVCPTPEGAPATWATQRYTPITTPPSVARRLVVEMNDRTRSDLAAMCELEGLNKTTVTNRALQLYRRLRDHQEGGGEILLQRPDGITERLVIL